MYKLAFTLCLRYVSKSFSVDINWRRPLRGGAGHRRLSRLALRNRTAQRYVCTLPGGVALDTKRSFVMALGGNNYLPISPRPVSVRCGPIRLPRMIKRTQFTPLFAMTAVCVYGARATNWAAMWNNRHAKSGFRDIPTCRILRLRSFQHREVVFNDQITPVAVRYGTMPYEAAGDPVSSPIE
jgi:hypothetical protein